MNKTIITLKDFELSPKENIIERSQNFQAYIDQMKPFGCKGYWVMSKTGVGAKMEIEGYDGVVSAYISNDYFGMSQREETKKVQQVFWLRGRFCRTFSQAHTISQVLC